ncbi:uncharacterized protein BX664DRAFT_273649 [Halteromyces radiatus]|uniref:uncharacterized protein n=1 Tax=Halteromyces radiatus TaxID=101107 RepID=UPI0022202D90|nr:uncharacterized protein BX664DRAFT_273649 [Halteromyces radiatus]KAI8100022.1 hypothetical protein BX664DRAFT_273649 [Halteromyces radiatus]
MILSTPRLIPFFRPFVHISKFSTTSSLLTSTTETTATTNTIVEPDDFFHRVDLRVGKIIDAEHHPEADHLYIEKVDVGEEQVRTIVSGLAKYMPKEELKDKQVIVVANLKPSRFRGVLSQGMLLAASNKSIVDLLTVPHNSLNGERVFIEGSSSSSSPDSILKPKQKVFEQVAQHLMTDDDGIATYKNSVLMTSAGPVFSTKVKHGQIS